MSNTFTHVLPAAQVAPVPAAGKRETLIVKTKKLLVALSLALLPQAAEAQISVSPDMFGQNAWYIDNSHTPYPDNVDALLPDVAASGVKYVRIGGIAANYDPLYDWNGDYSVDAADVTRLTGLIDKIRQYGMEPIIQVSHNPACSGKPLYGISLANQALIARNLVDRLNNHIYASNPITYWIIANEPDLPSNCANSGGGFGWSDYATETDDIANMMKEYATKMKDADPDIRIVGPELAMFGSDKYYDVNKIMNDLISAPSNANSIMGTISTGAGAGKYFVDVISFHTYPTLTNRQAVIDNPLQPATGFLAKMQNDGSTTNQWRGIVEMIENNSTGRSVSNLRIACTEFNIENCTSCIDEASNNTGVLQGYDNRSFLGGQWMAEMFFTAMGLNSGSSSWVKFMNPWSMKEGDCSKGMGYISNCGSDPKRPSYWHYKMVADHFSGGTYYPLVASGNADNQVKAYAGTKNGKVVVLILNQKTNSTQSSSSNTSVTVRFDAGTPAGTGAYKFRTASAVSGITFTEKTITGIDNESSWVYEYSSSGTLLKTCSYKLYGTNALTYNCNVSCTPPAAPTISSNSPVCQSQQINLYANTVAGATYSWTGPGGWTSSLEDPVRYGATTAMAGTYTCTITVGSCSSPASSLTVTVPDFSSIGPGGSTTFCSGGNVTLYAADGTGYTYQWIRNGSNISGATTDAYTATQAGDYQVKITRPDGCMAWSAPTTVSINTTQVARITAGGPTTFCSGGSVRLYANTCSGYSYQWLKKDANGVYQNISGATQAHYDATASGRYQVRTTLNGNHVWSSGIDVNVVSCRQSGAMEEQASPAGLTVYPNPTPGAFTVALDAATAGSGPLLVEVLNAVGQRVYQHTEASAGGNELKLPLSLDAQFLDGVYIIRVTAGERVLTARLLLAR